MSTKVGFPIPCANVDLVDCADGTKSSDCAAVLAAGPSVSEGDVLSYAIVHNTSSARELSKGAGTGCRFKAVALCRLREGPPPADPGQRPTLVKRDPSQRANVQLFAKGPDGTKGFAAGRGKAMPTAASASGDGGGDMQKQ